jgi:glycogen synthase
MRRAAMRQDFSWGRSAETYRALYRDVHEARS